MASVSVSTCLRDPGQNVSLIAAPEPNSIEDQGFTQW
jgi:hypothetical protein